MENSKNTIVAIFLMIGVWFLYLTFFQPAPQPAPEAPAAAETAAVSSVTAGTASASQGVDTETPASNIPARDISIETDKFVAVFTNVGARLKSIRLKEYAVDKSADSEPVSVIDVSNPRQATLQLKGNNGFLLSSETVYTVASEQAAYTLTGSEQQQLVFKTRTAAGLEVEKVFSFSADSYVIGLDVRLGNTGATPLQGDLSLSLIQPWTEDDEPEETMIYAGASTLLPEEVVKVEVDSIAEEPPTYGNQAIWTAFETKYFMTALVPLDRFEAVRVSSVPGQVENLIALPYDTVAPGANLNYSFLSYFGPRDKVALEAAGHRLVEAINYGFFDPIAAPLMLVLNYFYDHIGNYGIAIILLTVIIKLLFWPLTHKSYASMKAMQKLRPEMEKIKEKFKNDRARQGQETMELYKQHRVNPMGGCLPMLIQIPVFIGLYNALYQSIELRHAPFMFWITDLSAKDPYYITPLIMGATMFLQQKLTPSQMDPQQQKIFMLMPLIFTVLFLNFPAGLVIYWLVNNILTIVQQLYIHKTMS